MPMDRPERCSGEAERVRRIMSPALVAGLAHKILFRAARMAAPSSGRITYD